MRRMLKKFWIKHGWAIQAASIPIHFYNGYLAVTYLVPLVVAGLLTRWAAMQANAPDWNSVQWLAAYLAVSAALLMMLIGAAFGAASVRRRWQMQDPDGRAALEILANVGKGISRPESARESRLRARRKAETSTIGAVGEASKIEFPLNGNYGELQLAKGRNKYSVPVTLATWQSVWIYDHDECIKAITLLEAEKRGDLIDLRTLRPSRGTIIATVGKRVMVSLADGTFCQLLLVGVLNYDSGDDTDEARFKYVFHDGSEHLVPAM